MSYSASSSSYGPPRSDGGGFRGRGGGFRGGRNDSFRGGGRGSFHQRNDDRGRGGDSRYQPREQQPQQQQGAPPLPPPENNSSSGPPGRPDSARTGGNSRPQYSRYGTLITDSGEPGINSSSSSYRGGGGDRGRGGRDGGMPRYQNARGPPRPMMFVPPPHMNGAPRPMGMVPMMPHAGGAPVGGRGGHPVIGGLHVQLARGPPVMGGPVQMMHPQVFQVAPQQPPLPAPSNASPLPAGWSEHYTPQGLQYFFNTATGVSTYERPTAAAVAATAPVDNGSSIMSQENGGGDAGEGKWIEYKDDASGQLYYYHTATRETMWEQPKEFRIQQARDEVERMKKIAEEQAAAEAQAEEAKKKQEEEQKAKIYDHFSREERVALFKEFLEQKEISPQLKWQDAQRFIAKEGLDKDPRWKFALTSAGEKKQSFAEYCTQAINKQNIEKRRQVKKNREDFLELLAHFESLFVPGSFTKIEEQKKSSSSSSVIELEDVVESPHFYAVRQDARWLVIEDQKEKRSLFSGFMQDVVRKHDQLVAKQREAIKKQFIEFLRKKVDANEILLRGKRRLDSSLKTQLWDLLHEVGASAAVEDAHNTAEALKSVEKYDVYDWSEELMMILRDEEYEQRKRERELWREREAQLLKELEEELRAMVETAELTAAKQWEQVRDLLSPVDNESTTEETPGNAEGKPNEQQHVKEQKLSERAQMRVFEKVVEELRLALQPTVDAVSAYLSKASKGTGGGFEVHEACLYKAFADALTEGVKTTLEEKKPEDGEEEDVAMDGGDAGVSTNASGDEKMEDPVATGATATSPDAQKRQVQDELESLVKNIMETESETENSNASISVEFPQYVREVYDLLITLAKEKKAAAAASAAAAAAAPTAPNLSSSSDKDGNPRSVRSTSRSRKRRRDDDPSRSISRSRSRSRLQARSRSRSPPARSRSRSKPLDRSVVWKTSNSSTSKFIYDPLNGDDEDLTLLKKTKAAPLTAEEESARAEEIIRQARLKLQAKQDAKKKQQQGAADAKAEALAAGAHAVEEESELEDGEEPEEGEEKEE